MLCVFLLFLSYPRTVKGLHVNFAPPSKPGLPIVLSIMLGRRFPQLFGFTDLDIQRLFPCTEKLVVEPIKESGYMHIQATKPDTVGKDLGPVSANLQCASCDLQHETRLTVEKIQIAFVKRAPGADVLKQHHRSGRCVLAKYNNNNQLYL